MAERVRFNIDEAIKLYKDKGEKVYFSESLKNILKFAQKDKNITTKNELAYLLATAKVESNYSAERWESDYVCKSYGIAYKDKPCQTALNYYRSTNGKLNYYNLGTDKNGLPFFGRGLIQLTGKDNYIEYGNKLGLDLVSNPELIFKPKNSYNVISQFLKDKSFKYVAKNDLTTARRKVNPATSELSKVNKYYKIWLDIFNNPLVEWGVKKTDTTKILVVSVGIVSFLLLAFSVQSLIINSNSKR